MVKMYLPFCLLALGKRERLIKKSERRKRVGNARLVRHLLSILLMDGALVTKRVVCYCQRAR